MLDFARNLYLSLGGHVELPNKGFINPLRGYVENKAGGVEERFRRTTQLNLDRAFPLSPH